MNTTSNNHYICTGNCHGSSDKPDTCQAKDCVKYKQQLELCRCKDKKHDDRRLLGEEDKIQTVNP